MTKTMSLFLQMRDMGIAVNCAELDKMLEQEIKSEVDARLSMVEHELTALQGKTQELVATLIKDGEYPPLTGVVAYTVELAKGHIRAKRYE